MLSSKMNYRYTVIDTKASKIRKEEVVAAVFNDFDYMVDEMWMYFLEFPDRYTIKDLKEEYAFTIKIDRQLSAEMRDGKDAA